MSERTSFTLRQRLRYRFDNVFARGAVPVLLLLTLLLIIVFVVAGLIQAIFDWGPGDESVGFFEGFWLSFVRSLDPGTFSGDEGTHFRIIGLVITLLGVVAMAIIIGLVSSGIDTRLERLRQGRSLVVENGHSLILGSSLKVSSIVAELVEANASLRDAAIVILTPEPTEELERVIRSNVPDLRTSRLVLRSGDPSNVHDLAIVNPTGARSIIVLGGDGAAGDSATVKTVMAVLRLTEDNPTPTVTEVQDRAIAEALKVATDDRVIVVVSSEIVGRLTAQVTRNAGLSIVYQELLDFSGDEVYMTPADSLAGLTYGAALQAFEQSALIGLRSPDGSVSLNPPMNRVIAHGESVVVIAEDDDKIGQPSKVDWDSTWAPRVASDEAEVESTLIIGWSHYVHTIAEEIDGYVSPGSSLDIVVDPALSPNTDVQTFGLLNQQVRVFDVDSLDLRTLEPIVRGGGYRHVLIMCYRDVLTPDEADARALLTLMAVRQWVSDGECNVVTELLEVEDASLAEVARPDDFVVSERLMSLALAQISENPDLAAVFRDLLDSFSVAVRMRSWRDYELTESPTFADVVSAARRQGETAIGWKCAAMAGHARDLGGAIFINPPKSLQARFENDDHVIVIG